MKNKTILCMALSSACLVTATSALAALPANALLNFNAGVIICKAGGTPPNCTYGASDIASGSYFSMDANGDGSVAGSEKVAISEKDGLFVGTTQTASGSHGGAINGSEVAGIDNPWGFFGNTGMHFAASPTTIQSTSGNTASINFSGWSVTWNGIARINMGGGIQDCGTSSDGLCVDKNGNDLANIGGVPYNNGTGFATVNCFTDSVFTTKGTCAAGDFYTLDYSAKVPQADLSGFGGVGYTLHLEGKIVLQPNTNVAPVAVDDTATVDRQATGRTYTPSTINILANDTDAPTSDINPATVSLNTTSTLGTVSVDTAGVVTYIPKADFLGSDSFTYQVSDKGGPTAGSASPNILTSNVATVTITVQDAPPVAVNDTAKLDTSSASSVTIDVVANDTDSDGTVNVKTVVTDPANPPTNGSVNVNATTGVVTYTANAGFIGTDRFKYTVKDNDGVSSNLATVVINVSGGVGILPANAFLIINAGTGVAGQGSYFSMEVKPGQLTTAGIVGFDHVHLGVKQPASVAMPDIDEPWKFFGNLGVDQTTKPITILTDDKKGNVTLDFSGWDVSWNNIPSIPLNNGLDNGIATLTCAKDCSVGDSYTLIYHATVPPGDPSGFGGVHYILHLIGTIAFKAPTVGGGSAAAAYNVTTVDPIVAVDDSSSTAPNPITIGPGSIASKAGMMSGIGLTPAEVGKDPSLNNKDGEQCIGGCIDFVATGVTTPFVDLVFKLSKPIPDGAVFRKLINGKWSNFDTSVKDQVGTANADASGNCQVPQGKYNTGLRKGATCVFLRIYDNGPNDTDSTKGVIADPSGVLLAGSSNVPPGSSSISSSGCSLSPTPVSLESRADWLLVAGFISLLGLLGIKRKSHD